MRGLSKTLDEIDAAYDVVIIGSGYGGGVSASRLARAGKRVAVLERGREFLTGDFPGRFPDLRSEFCVTSKNIKTGSETALYDIRLGEDMHVLVGCGLGGGSLVNAGVALRPDPRVFADEVWPGQIAQDGLLDEGYKRARQWLRPARFDNAGGLTKVKALTHCTRGMKASRSAVTQVVPEVVVSFEDNVNPAGVAQPACTLCGDCCGGCNVGAKNTVALTYLPDAVRHGASLFTHAKVSYIEKRADGGWVVHVERLGSDGKGDVITVAADSVIVAAGTLGSSELLLRSAAHGLALSRRLGENFSANGDIIAFGYGADIDVNAIGVGHPAKVDVAPVGAAVSAQLEINDPENLENGMCIQEGVLPSAVAPMLPVMFVPNGRLLGALKSLVAGVYNGPFKHLQTFFAVSHDSGSGRFKLEGDRLALSWPGAKDEPVYARLDKALDDLVTAGGGSYVKNPLAGTVMGHQPATAHPLGGCSIGRGHGDGVVNHKAQVFDASHRESTTAVHEGLYVIDGSIIPRSLGVNPLLTITALAERALIHMSRDHGFSFDVDAVAGVEPVKVDEPGAVTVRV